MTRKSPPDVLSIDEIPLEHVHVEYVQVQTVGLNAVQFAISTNLWLPLIEVTLSPGLAVELLNFRARRVEEVAVVGLLV